MKDDGASTEVMAIELVKRWSDGAGGELANETCLCEGLREIKKLRMTSLLSLSLSLRLFCLSFWVGCANITETESSGRQI